LSEDATNSLRGPPIEDLQDLYENAPCGYLSIQTDGRIFKVNTTFSTWIGFPSEQLLCKRLHDLLNVAGRIFYETHFVPLLRMQGFFNEVALDLITREGKRLPALVNAAERRDTEGRHLFTRLTIFNATDRRRYERELLEARAAAETANKKLQEANAVIEASLLDERETAALREQFIAVLGHDLRNPLAAIAGAIELLTTTPSDERIIRITNMAQRSIDRMSGLIDDILDFARGRLGGGLALSFDTEISLQAVLEQVIAETQASWPDRQIETQYRIADTIKCDTSRIAQLFSNLLANAMTHGAADTPVRVRASISGGMFQLAVANAGEPIPPAALERLFQPFFRGAVRPGQGGLGLGLYIASEIARAHGGVIEVISSREATRFTFKMPVEVGGMAIFGQIERFPLTGCNSP
jgi:sigma-B regulation protein RsbU (phosphoserine phosphatase)